MSFKTGIASMFAAVGECCSFSLQWRGGSVALSFPTPRCRKAFEEAGHDVWSHPGGLRGCFPGARSVIIIVKKSFLCKTLLPFTRHYNQTLLVSVVTIFPLTSQTGLEFCLLYMETIWFPTELNPLPWGLRKKPRQINLRNTTGWEGLCGDQWPILGGIYPSECG